MLFKSTLGNSLGSSFFLSPDRFLASMGLVVSSDLLSSLSESDDEVDIEEEDEEETAVENLELEEEVGEDEE